MVYHKNMFNPAIRFYTIYNSTPFTVKNIGGNVFIRLFIYREYPKVEYWLLRFSRPLGIIMSIIFTIELVQRVGPMIYSELFVYYSGMHIIIHIS